VAPTATAHARRAPATSSQISVSWSGNDPSPSSGLTAYVVRVTHRGSSIPDYAATTTGTMVRLSGMPGRRYTVTVTAVDAAGHRSRTATAAVAIPLDDRSFAVTSRWRRTTGNGAYRGTFTVTGNRGATATLRATGQTFALLAQRCPRCGSVAVYVDGHYVRKLSLTSSRPRNLVAFTVARYARAGRHRLTVRILRGTARLDGLLVR
jgi:hypothetical protein